MLFRYLLLFGLFSYGLAQGTLWLLLVLDDDEFEKVPTDGTGRVSVADFSNGKYRGLECQYRTRQVGNIDVLRPPRWRLRGSVIPRMSVDNELHYSGWISEVYYSGQRLETTLQRVRALTATEGIFKCTYANKLPVSVGIFYPISSVSAAIEVISGREGTFRVRCTSTGGRTERMVVDGPEYSSEEGDQMIVESVGVQLGIGNDTYTATTSTISGGCDGDIYQCTASNGVVPDPTNSVRLRVSSDPLNISLTQTSATSVIVEWSQPSGGATVTGYVVHYSDGVTNMTQSVPASSTSLLVTGLSSGLSYTFSVEATSKHLSAESPSCTISMGAYNNLNFVQCERFPSPSNCTPFREPTTMIPIPTASTKSTPTKRTSYILSGGGNVDVMSTPTVPGQPERMAPGTPPNDSRSDITWILILILAVLIASILFCIILFLVCICRRCLKIHTKSHAKSNRLSLKRLSIFENFRGFTPSLLHTNPVYVSHDSEAIAQALSADTMTTDTMKGVSDKRENLEKYILKVEMMDQKDSDFFEPLPTEKFEDYVIRCHFHDNKDFKHQFTVLADCGSGFSAIAGSTSSHQKFNRYANIMPYDVNRVILMPIEGHADCQRDYINASYIDGWNYEHKFIATQGPLPNTTVDFWRMVWQDRSQTIVMVTNLVEGNRIKCHKYWPETGTMTFGPFNVTITGQQILADYTTRRLRVQLTGSSEPALSVTQFHFTAWPDHGVPDYATSLLAFHRKLMKHHKPAKGPIIVHCSAGVGRTGTLITIDCVLEQLQEEKVVDIAGIIIHLRTQRMKMVQNVEQYTFIHDAILDFLTCGDTQIVAYNLCRVTQKMSTRDPNTHLTGFEKEFEVLEKFSPKPLEITRNEALQNPTKNRSDDYLPGDAWRVVLKGDLQNYIHAVYVHGYKQQRAFIIAQSPMESTARDFWKMVHDRKCGVIVMLCNLVEDEQEICYQYWPQTGLIQFVGYTVDLMEEKVMEGFTMRKISVYNEKTGSAHQVVQLHMTNWSPDGSCSHLATITSVMNEMSAIQRRTGNNPVLVHCSDTVSRSGMFCAIVTTIERCKTEGVVDVFQVVKTLRVQKPGALLTVAQYHLLFEVVSEYLESIDNYCNFLDL